MIIDFHVHCFPDELAYKTVPKLAVKAGVEEKLDGTIGQLKQSMKKVGITYSVLQPIATKPSQTVTINNWVASLKEEKIIPFGTVHPLYPDWKQEIERIKNLGFKGVKFHPDYQDFFVNDKRLFPIYKKILDMGLLILFHAGIDIGLPAPVHCSPHRLRKVVDLFPHNQIIASHMGGFKCWDNVEEYLVGCELYLDTSYSLNHMARKQFLRIISNHGYHKILFGSDSPWEDQEEEVNSMKDLEMGKEVETAILGDNARKLLSEVSQGK